METEAQAAKTEECTASVVNLHTACARILWPYLT